VGIGGTESKLESMFSYIFIILTLTLTAYAFYRDFKDKL
jgi:hypothetical protein